MTAIYFVETFVARFIVCYEEEFFHKMALGKGGSRPNIFKPKGQNICLKSNKTLRIAPPSKKFRPRLKILLYSAFFITTVKGFSSQ